MRYNQIALLLSTLICLSCSCRKDKYDRLPLILDGIFAYMAEDKNYGECIYLHGGLKTVNISSTWKINSIRNPRLSDDGSTLYFEGRENMHYGIYRYDISTGKVPVRITPDTDNNFTQARLSHKGNSMLINRDGQIVELDLDSGDITTLTFGTGQDEMPCGSADGDKVYFIHKDKDTGKSSLICLQRDDLSQRSIDTPRGARISNPICDVDGNLFYIYEGKGLCCGNRLLVEGAQSANIALGKFVTYDCEGKGYIANPWRGSSRMMLHNISGSVSYSDSNVIIAHPENGGKVPGTDKITSDTERPSLGGKMVYHNYTSYDAMDSRMYVYDFASDGLTEISRGWTSVKHPMNGHFSPDGKHITFMGIGTATNSWDIFLYELGSTAEPANLTSSGDWRDEDPKFSYSGEKICFKRNDHLCEYIIASGQINMLSKYNTEPYSMPYYTTDDCRLLVGAGADPNSYIGLWDIASSTMTRLYDKAGTVEYYPVTIDGKTFYYTQHISPTDHHDQIYKGYFDGSTSECLPFNKSSADYSDACPVSDGWLILVSTRPGSSGGYDLYIANERSGAIYSLSDYNSQINTYKNELGADYIPSL